MTRRALLATAALRAATPDWQSLLARSIIHDEENFEQLRRYVFEVHDLSLAFRRVREAQSYEINLVGPGMYFRKLTHNDLPLSPADAALEQARLRAHLSQPQTSNAQAPWRKERDFLQQYLDTHTFRFKGEKTIDRRPALVIESKFPANAPQSLAFLSSAQCRLTIDRDSGHWIEAVCDLYKRTQFNLNQLLIGRLSLPYSPGLVNRGDIPAGTTLTFRTQHLEDGVWAPKSYRIERPGFLSALTFSKFRKFTSESQLLTAPQ